jgi:CHAT domain-containing protein
MGADGQAICAWSPLSLSRWCSATEGLLESPDRTELQRRLWDALFEPLHAHLTEGSQLIVVPPPDGCLVPYGLFRDARGRFAVDRFALSLAPSLATLRTLGDRGPWLRPRPRRAFILGDPTRGGDGADALPAARAEALAVRARLLRAGMPESAITLRLGGAADLEAYRSEAAHCDLVHLACHAEIVATTSGHTWTMRLAGSAQGHLHASEVPDVPLDDALVVLSACSSGQGRASADGVIGLGRAFIRAGARAVVVSLWPVGDEVAAALFEHFYTVLFEEPGSHDAAQALTEATRRTRDDLKQQRIKDESGPLPPNAAGWAPFVIVGDAQAVRFRSTD